jgi:hypothetical protein
MPAPEWANLKVGYAASDSAACSGNTTAASQPAERPESARQALHLISSEPGSTLIVEAKLAPESESRQWEHTEMLLIIERAMQHILENPSEPSSATSCVSYDSSDTTGGRTPPFDSEPASTCTSTIQLPPAPRASPCVPRDSTHTFLTEPESRRWQQELAECNHDYYSIEKLDRQVQPRL